MAATSASHDAEYEEHRTFRFDFLKRSTRRVISISSQVSSENALGVMDTRIDVRV